MFAIVWYRFDNDIGSIPHVGTHLFKEDVDTVMWIGSIQGSKIIIDGLMCTKCEGDCHHSPKGVDSFEFDQIKYWAQIPEHLRNHIQ